MIPRSLRPTYSSSAGTLRSSGWLTCGERRRVLRKKPRRQPTVTDSTDRMSSPFLLHTSFPRARMAPGTMVSPACWPGARYHSMHVKPAGVTGSQPGALAAQQAGGAVAKHRSPAPRPWPAWLSQREATILLPAASLGARNRLGPGKLEQATWSGVLDLKAKCTS